MACHGLPPSRAAAHPDHLTHYFPAQLLGRADKAQSFVKHGKEQGFTEIELFNPDDSNWVIQRTVTRDANVSHWKLNGALNFPLPSRPSDMANWATSSHHRLRC